MEANQATYLRWLKAEIQARTLEHEFFIGSADPTPSSSEALAYLRCRAAILLASHRSANKPAAQDA